MQLDAFLNDVIKNAPTFWASIAPNFWPGLFLIVPTGIVTITFTRWDRSSDARKVAARVQEREYTDWRGRYVSGAESGTKPSPSEIDVALRWFIIRKSDDSKKVLLTNRAKTQATSVRVTADTWKKGKVKRWRKFRAGKTARLKVGQVPDHNAEGIRLEIHWDDASGLAHTVTFLVPLGDKLPTPTLPNRVVASAGDDGNVNAAPAKSAVEVGDTVSAHQETTTLTNGTNRGNDDSSQAEPRFEPQEARAEKPKGNPQHRVGDEKTASRTEPEQQRFPSPAAPLPEIQQPDRGAVVGLSPSNDIANRSIPNRTPGMPANFSFVYNSDKKTLGLKNEGPGDASKIYLQPHDDAQAIVGGGFWHSIPAYHVQQFKLANDRTQGIFAMKFELSWDDGFELRRTKDMVIPGIGD